MKTRVWYYISLSGSKKRPSGSTAGRLRHGMWVGFDPAPNPVVQDRLVVPEKIAHADVEMGNGSARVK